tara:strand:- start:9988 stop:10806 length:819 start_codon:yes stop_codon:yes gene_type:complete
MTKQVEYIPLNNYYELADYLGLEPKMTDWIRESKQYDKVFKHYNCELPSCGSAIRKGVIVRDLSSDTDMVIGWDCMDSIDGGKLRAQQGKKLSQSKRSLDVIYSFITKYKMALNYWVEILEEVANDESAFLRKAKLGFGGYAKFVFSLVFNYSVTGRISEKQCQALEKALLNREKNLYDYAEEIKSLSPITKARKVIEGTILTITKKDTAYGLNIKAVIKTKDNEKFITNLPYEFFDRKDLVGKNVSMKVTLAPTHDEYFGKGTRPSNVVIK